MEQEYEQIITHLIKKGEISAESLDKIKDNFLFAQCLGNKKPSVKLWNRFFVSNLRVKKLRFFIG